MRRVARLAVGIAVAAGVAGFGWLHSASGRPWRARLALAASPAWSGVAVLTAPGWRIRVDVRWQRPGWWRVQGSGGVSAYDGRELTVRLPGGPDYAAPGTGGAWAELWPEGALAAAPRSLVLGPGGRPVGWTLGSVTVRYTDVARVPRLPRAAFRLAVPAAAVPPPPLLGGDPAFTVRAAPGLRPEWRAVAHPPGAAPAVVLAYASAEGTITLAENPGTCAGGPLWVRAPDGWIAHWCAGGMAFTARGPGGRAALEPLVRALS